MLSMLDLDLRGKRVLIREDFNVPMKGGEITDDTRLRAALPTVKAARDAGVLRLEGKEHEVLDGDVVHFRFNV